MDKNTHFRNTIIGSITLLGATMWYVPSHAETFPIDRDEYTSIDDIDFGGLDQVISAEIIASPPEDPIEVMEIPVATNLKHKIARANFTHGMQGHEPIDAIVSISETYGKMYYFTELVDLQGKVIKHRWEYNGQVIAEVKFDVGSPRWRVYSSKTIDHNWLGTWTVVITDDAGLTISKNSIVVVE